MIKLTKSTLLLPTTLLLLFSCSNLQHDQSSDAYRMPSSIKKGSCEKIMNLLAKKSEYDTPFDDTADVRFFQKYINLKNFKEMSTVFWKDYKNTAYEKGDFPNSPFYTFMRMWNDNPYVPQYYNKPSVKSGNIDTVATISRIADRSQVYTEDEKNALIAGEEWFTHVKGISEIDYRLRLKNGEKISLSELGHARRMNIHLEQGFISKLTLEEKKKYIKNTFPQVIPLPKIVNGKLEYLEVPFETKTEYLSELTSLTYDNKRALPQGGFAKIFNSSRLSAEETEYAFYYRRFELLEKPMKIAYAKGNLNQKQIDFYKKVKEFLLDEQYRPKKTKMLIVRKDESWAEFHAMYKFWQQKRIVYEARFNFKGEDSYEAATQWTKVQVFGRAMFFYGTASTLALGVFHSSSYYVYYSSKITEGLNWAFEKSGGKTSELVNCAESSDRAYHMVTGSSVRNYIDSKSGSVYDETRIDRSLDPTNDEDYLIQSTYEGVKCFQIRTEYKSAKQYRDIQIRIPTMASFESHVLLFQLVGEKRGEKVKTALKNYIDNKEITKNKTLTKKYFKELKDLTDDQFMKELKEYRAIVQKSVQALILDGSFIVQAKTYEGYIKKIQAMKEE